MRYVTDNDWKTCKAMVGNLLDYSIEVEDTGVANFEFTDGSHGFFMGTNAYYGNDSMLYGRDPFDCLADSRDSLYEYGFKDLF